MDMYTELNRIPGKGYFVVFESFDGAGKSTQTLALVDYVRNHLGLPVVALREPGGTPNSEVIRSLILAPEKHDCTTWDAVSQLMLYSVARRELMKTKIIPALNANSIVICDRFTLSTLAYQHFGCGVPRQIVQTMISLATDDIAPDRTLLLTAPFEVCQKRLAARQEVKNNWDEVDRRVALRIHDGYDELKNSERNIIQVDADQRLEEVTRDVLTTFTRNCLPEIKARSITRTML